MILFVIWLIIAFTSAWQEMPERMPGLCQSFLDIKGPGLNKIDPGIRRPSKWKGNMKKQLKALLDEIPFN